MLNIQAANLFLALSRAEKISSRKAIPIGSKMAFTVYPPGQQFEKNEENLSISNAKTQKVGPQESFQLINPINAGGGGGGKFAPQLFFWKFILAKPFNWAISFFVNL